jgi:hypothetical protein
MDQITVILPAVLVAIALVAPRYGVDSRLPPPGDPPPPRRSPTVTGDVAMLLRRARQVFAWAFHSH